MRTNFKEKVTNLMSDGTLLEIVDNSLSSSEVLLKLGYTKKGQYVTWLREYLIDNEVDISHWTANGKPLVSKVIKTCPACKKEFLSFPRDKQVACSYSCSNTVFRSGENNPNYVNGAGSYRSRALKYYNNCCKYCSYNNPDALEVHHIDKNRENNSIENLEVVCANCHTLIHKGKTF